MIRRALLILLACAAQGVPTAAAQAERRVHVEGPSCPPPWYDDDRFVDALRVELAGHGVIIERGGDDDGTRLRVARPACDDDGDVVTVAIDEDAQRVSLVDLAPSARLRTLAIATSDRILTPPALAPPEPAPPEPEPAPPQLALRRAVELGRPSARSEPPPLPVPATPIELRLGVGGLVALTARSLNAFGGASLALELTFGAVPLFARLSPLVLAGGAQHPLGRVDALLIGGALGLGVDLRVGVFRCSPRLELAVAHAQLIAETTRPDVLTEDETRALVWIEPAVHVGLDVDRFWIGLQLGAPIVVSGVEARAVEEGDDGQPVLTVAGLLLRAELALGARFDLGG